MKINVVNKHTHISTQNDFYIGRPSILSNVYSHNNYKNVIKVESREKAVECYEYYIKKKIEERDEKILKELNKIYVLLKQTGEVNLVCYCSPKSCRKQLLLF